jgi:hypothetical protein
LLRSTSLSSPAAERGNLIFLLFPQISRSRLGGLFTHPVIASPDHPLFACGGKREFDFSPVPSKSVVPRLAAYLLTRSLLRSTTLSSPAAERGNLIFLLFPQISRSPLGGLFTHPVIASPDHPLFACGGKREFDCSTLFLA